MKLNKLQLTNFRQFKKKSIEFNKPWTILVGPNAQGKSTIIESIFMLSEGSSPWTFDHTKIIRLDHEKVDSEKPVDKLLRSACRIEAEVETQDDIKDISISLTKNNDSTTKQYEINNGSTSKGNFSQMISCVLFSPDMIDMLMFEPAQRRKFLNTYISKDSQEYDELLTNYRKVVRQRNSLLKILYNFGKPNKKSENGFASEDTLEYWTKQLIDSGSRITYFRHSFAKELNTLKSELYPTKIVYTPSIELSEYKDKITEEKIKQQFIKQLEQKKEKEKRRGVTVVGSHRDDWYLQSEAENINVYGSRGEKRIAIADIIFKINYFFKYRRKSSPILLLDDISSELDNNNISILFSEKLSQKQQTIITTTELETLPDKAVENSQIVEL